MSCALLSSSKYLSAEVNALISPLIGYVSWIPRKHCWWLWYLLVLLLLDKPYHSTQGRHKRVGKGSEIASAYYVGISILICCIRPSSPFSILVQRMHDADDIYIMMKCLSVCVCVTKNHHFPLPGWALWPSGDDD